MHLYDGEHEHANMRVQTSEPRANRSAEALLTTPIFFGLLTALLSAARSSFLHPLVSSLSSAMSTTSVPPPEVGASTPSWVPAKSYRHFVAGG